MIIESVLESRLLQKKTRIWYSQRMSRWTISKGWLRLLCHRRFWSQFSNLRPWQSLRCQSRDLKGPPNRSAAWALSRKTSKSRVASLIMCSETRFPGTALLIDQIPRIAIFQSPGLRISQKSLTTTLSHLSWNKITSRSSTRPITHWESKKR